MDDFSLFLCRVQLKRFGTRLSFTRVVCAAPWRGSGPATRNWFESLFHVPRSVTFTCCPRADDVRYWRVHVCLLSQQIDLADIKTKYREMYRRSLEDEVKSECTGNYRNLLLAILSEKSAIGSNWPDENNKSYNINNRTTKKPNSQLLLYIYMYFILNMPVSSNSHPSLLSIMFILIPPQIYDF